MELSLNTLKYEHLYNKLILSVSGIEKFHCTSKRDYLKTSLDKSYIATPIPLHYVQLNSERITPGNLIGYISFAGPNILTYQFNL